MTRELTLIEIRDNLIAEGRVIPSEMVELLTVHGEDLLQTMIKIAKRIVNDTTIKSND